jgi:hypothetical protein
MDVPVGLEGDASSTPRVLSAPVLAHHLGRQLETMLRTTGDELGASLESRHEMAVAGIAGVGHQDFAATPTSAAQASSSAAEAPAAMTMRSGAISSP